MKRNILLIIGTCLGLQGCTPAEVQIAETVFHEAEVAEQAIENDLECPGCAPHTCTGPSPQPTPDFNAPAQIKTQKRPGDFGP